MKCPKCKRLFLKNETLARHIAEVHGKQLAQEAKPKQELPAEEPAKTQW